MKKIFSWFFISICMIGIVGVVGSMVATERVPEYMNRVAIEVVDKNIIEFLNKNLQILGIDEQEVRSFVDNSEFINNTVELYSSATLEAVDKMKKGKVDVSKYLNKNAVVRELKGTMKDIVYGLVEFFGGKIDFKYKLLINEAISIGASKIADVVADEISDSIKKIPLKYRIEIRLYNIVKVKEVRTAIIILALISFVMMIVLSLKQDLIKRLGLTFFIPGAVLILMLLYNLVKSHFKIIEFIGISIPLNLTKYFVISGDIFAVGLILLLISKREKKIENTSISNDTI